MKQLLNQFKDRQKVQWQVRVAALKALLDIELQSKGLEAAVNLALQQVHGDLSFGGEVFDSNPYSTLFHIISKQKPLPLLEKHGPVSLRLYLSFYELDCGNLADSMHIVSLFLTFQFLTGFSGRTAVQSKIMKHVVRMASITEKGKCRIGGVTIARLLALLESSKAFHNVMLRHSIFSFLQVLAGRYDMLILLLAFIFGRDPLSVKMRSVWSILKNCFTLNSIWSCPPGRHLCIDQLSSSRNWHQIMYPKTRGLQRLKTCSNFGFGLHNLQPLLLLSQSP